MKQNPYIVTFSGLRFYPLSPTKETIHIADIARSLSQQGRFSGHTSRYYSVAQHCVLVSELSSGRAALAGLLHDAAEAYILDIPRPIKQLSSMSGYRKMDEAISKLIFKKYNVSFDKEIQTCVKNSDNIALYIEAYNLMSIGSFANIERFSEYVDFILPAWSSKEAEKQFLLRFKDLIRSDR